MPDYNIGALLALKSAIASNAPQLAALLDGAHASIAICALGKTLLGDAEASLTDVTAAAQKADKLELVAAEQEAQMRLRQRDGGSLTDLKVQEMNARSTEVANARQRQIQIHDKTNQVLAYVVTAAFFILIALLMFANSRFIPNIDSGVKGLLFALLGVVATGWANIIGFYFGSSVGSVQKSQVISDALMSGSSASLQAGSQS